MAILSGMIICNETVDRDVAERLMRTNFAGTALEGHPETDEDYATGVVVVDGRYAVDEDDLPADCVERRFNGETEIRKYSLNDETAAILELGANDVLTIVPARITIWDYLQDWGFGDDVSREEGLVAFGYAACPEEAERDAENVRIWVERYYHDSTLGAPVDGYLRDESGQIRVFPTFAAAKAWIRKEECGVYILSHGEYERPDYTVVD